MMAYYEEGKEKFVLIPESEWDSVYKKQQDIINDLKYELEHRDITIFIHRSYGFGHTGLDNIGLLSIDARGAYKIKDFNKDNFLRAVYFDLRIDLSKTKDEEQRLIDASNKIKNIPKLIRWIFRIKP